MFEYAVIVCVCLYTHIECQDQTTFILSSLGDHGDRITDLESTVKALKAEYRGLLGEVSSLRQENTKLKSEIQTLTILSNRSQCCCEDKLTPTTPATTASSTKQSTATTRVIKTQLPTGALTAKTTPTPKAIHTQTDAVTTCADDPSFDCALTSTTFDICADVTHARVVCRQFCNLCNKGTTVKYEIRVGDLVIRGPDWKYGNQDKGGKGRIEAVEYPVPGFVQVHWMTTNITNVYRMDTTGMYNGKHDVILYNGTMPTTTTVGTTTQGVTKATIGTTDKHGVSVGDLVVRSPDWIYGNQDIHGIGRIIAVGYPMSGFVQVHWITADLTNVYRMDTSGMNGGKHDVILYNGTMSLTSTLGVKQDNVKQTNVPPTIVS